jgi:hypothetical protein
MHRAFVIRGFGKHRDSSGAEFDFNRVDAELVTPALQQCGLGGGTTGQIVQAGIIHVDMFAMIVEADIVICDITVHNANVFYELGIRHAMRKKHTLLIKGDPTVDKTPFDLLGDRYLSYPADRPADALERLVAAIKASLNGHRETDSPVFQMLPTLPESDFDHITVMPIEVSEDVARAEAAQDKGWLRLIADELKGERFELIGLRCVAPAQFALGDYDAAWENWTAIRNANPTDIDANLALADIDERLYRRTSQRDLLEASDQAIRRVIDNPRTPLASRAEALARHGRNLKTLWRLEFRTASTLEERRAIALNGKLNESFEAYRRAFFADLNHHYPGIAALQMGAILQSFAQDADWLDLFGGSSTEGQHYREALDEQLPSLRHVVQTAATNTRDRESETTEDRMWAAITLADLSFLACGDEFNAADERRLIRAYRNAIPAGKRFAWDATKGQLQLFAELGIKAQLAAKVVAALDEHFGHAGILVSKPLHLVVFCGYLVDKAGATTPRFPAEREVQARALIEEKLSAFQRANEELIVLASAAPGADILAHEVCQELGVRRVLCLPMPPESIVREVFDGYPDVWRGRFFSIVENSRAATCILGSGANLPGWLRNKNASVWERGTKWVIRLSQAWGANKTTLVAMWDGKSPSGSTDGTAYMVELARNSGMFRLESIDTAQLLDPRGMSPPAATGSQDTRPL